MEYIETVEGTNITIENSNDDNTLDVVFCGNTIQDESLKIKNTRGITNIYDYSFRNSNVSIRTSNCTISEEDGIFTMTTTGDDAYMWEVVNENETYNYDVAGQLFEFVEDTYTLNISDNTLDNNYITYYDANKTSLGFVRNTSNVVNISSSDKTNAKYFSIRIGQNSNVGTDVTHIFTIMLTAGANVYDYIPYGKYKIFVTSSSETSNDTVYELDLSKENLFIKSNVIENANIDSTGTVYSDSNSKLYYINVESNNKYIIHQSYERQYVYSFFNAIPDIGTTGTNRIVTTDSDLIITIPDNYNYLVIREYNNLRNEQNETLIVTKGTQIYEELCSIDTVFDKISKNGLKWYFYKYIEKIDSYDGETITGSYISTTGDLTTGATVYYQLSTPTVTEITNTERLRQLNNIYNMKLPYGTVYVDSYGDLPVKLIITYNNWNKYINPSDRQALLNGTATIETKLVYDRDIYEKVKTQFLFDYTEGTFTHDGIKYSFVVRAEYIHVESGQTYKVLLDDSYYLKQEGQLVELFSSLPTDIEEFSGFTPIASYTLSTSHPEQIFTIPENANYLGVMGIYYNPVVSEESDVDDSLPNVLPPENDSFNVYKLNNELTQGNSIISWDYEDFRYVKDEGWIGQFVARQLTGELKNISDDFSITDEDLELQLGVRTNNNTNWYSLGNFLVNKVTDDDVNDKTSFEALDYTKKFNKLYVDRITYPCTAGELAQDVCDQCEVELGNNVFKNSDYIIEGNVFNNNETCRDVMKAIGKLAFSWVRVDWDNKVYFDFYKQNNVNEFNKANNSKYYNLKTQKEKFGPVNRIIIGYSQIEGERTKIEDAGSIDENGLYEVTVYDNPLVYTQAQRESIIESARDLLGLEYMPLNTLTVGHPWLQGDDLFEITDMEGNTFNTIPFDRTIQYFGHIKTAIDVATATKTNTEYAYESDIAKAAYNAEIQVNKVTGEITALTNRTTVVENTINNTYTKEQTNELVQNAEYGVTNTFSESGGNNIFRNTGLWFTQNDENNPYEFWNGDAEQIKEEKASNYRGILLKQGTLYQEQIVPNGNYTVSFKYKKLINLANVKCVINDIEYPLTSTNDTEFVQTIEVSSQHINVKFITDIDDSCEIYDLMVNTGTVKLAYSQNQNETTTDTVNISKGITITSTDTDTTFKANADGIRTLDRNGNELTKFTDTGMTTKKMIVEDTSEIVGLLVQQVGNQTWFTKL